jgi:predicted branched-subunit amino acid permease
VLLGVAPFGLITGVAMVASGIPAAMAVLMSITVFAGASMIASALASGVTVVLAHGLPLRLAVPLAALTGIGAGLALRK